MKRKGRIIIIGANFAGLAAAKYIGTSAKVTLIDPHPYFEYIPGIHELVSQAKAPDDLRLSRQKLIQKLGHKWIQDQVVALEPEHNRVQTSDGSVLEYDSLIFAIGGVNNFHGVEGADKYSYPFKSVDNCFKIGKRYRELKWKEEPFHIVIAGGGSEGIECLGELLRKTHKKRLLNIYLVEPAHRLLPGQSSKVSKKILKICRKKPVNFYFNCRISEVRPKEVLLSNGTSLPSDMTIWTGGVKPNPLLLQSGLTSHPDEWGDVNNYMQSKNFKNIFIAGDSAEVPGTKSKQSYFALQTGEIAGKNAYNYLFGQEFREFEAVKQPSLYSFGKKTCFIVNKKSVLEAKWILNVKKDIFKRTVKAIKKLHKDRPLVDIYDNVIQAMGSGSETFLNSTFSIPFDMVFRAFGGRRL